MKNNYVNKILPLTLKDLKAAEVELKARKNRVYDGASYQVIESVARVVKISGMDVKVTDESEIIQFVLYKDPLRDALTLMVNEYYRFQFIPKRNILKGGNVDGFGFEINNIKRVNGDQLTGHIANCLCEKIGREKFKSQQSLMSEHNNNNTGRKQNEQFIMYSNNQNFHNLKSSSNYNRDQINRMDMTQALKESKTLYHSGQPTDSEQQITKYCRQVNTEFDKEMIFNHFEQRFSYREIQRILQILCEQGEVMDLGQVYQWVGDSAR